MLDFATFCLAAGDDAKLLVAWSPRLVGASIMSESTLPSLAFREQGKLGDLGVTMRSRSSL
jgi:hypothetical protein